jgi:hypothetical protein
MPTVTVPSSQTPVETSIGPPSVSSQVLSSLADLLRRLCEVLALQDEYDGDYLAPTAEVVAAAAHLLVETAASAVGPWPKGRLGVIGDGGLGIEWHSDGGTVNLVVPPNPERAFVYSEISGRELTESATPPTLIRALFRLTER